MYHLRLKALSFKLGLPVVALAMSVSAHATTVKFSTTGFFTCTIACTGSGTNVVTFGSGADSVTLDFVGAPTTNKQLIASNGFFSVAHGGTFVTTDNAAEQSDDVAIPVGAVFHLTVDQSSPTAPAGMLTGNVEGNLGDDFSVAAVQFPAGQTSLVLGGISYLLQQQTHSGDNGAAGYDLESPGGAQGDTTLQMNLQGSAALPEPTFLALTGIGFAGLSVIAYRRRKRA